MTRTVTTAGNGRRGRHAARIVSALAWASLCAACASPTPPELLDARAGIASAKQDPEVAAEGSVQLYEAEKALARAEQAWRTEGDPVETAHLARLAGGRVEIARVSASANLAEKEVEQLMRQRDTVRLTARTAEAERARSAAEVQAGEATRARLEAEQQARDAEAARLQADAARVEAEGARMEAEGARAEAAEAAERERRLREQLTELEAKQTDRGLVLTLGDVLFDVDQATLKPGALKNLVRLVSFLRENPDREVLIEGHTDSTGSDSYNLDLSQRRAEAVREFLAENEIDASRVVARGYGKTYPVASNDSSAGRQRNRRVEIVILDAGEKAIDEARPSSPGA